MEKIYVDAERTRLLLWAALKHAPQLEDIVEEDTLTDATISVREEKNGFTVVVNDVLPRSSNLGIQMLREHWLGIMSHALSKVDKSRKFKKVLCIINVFGPAAYWDTDNRAHKIIIDSLHYGRIVPDDSNQYLAYMVTGEVDPKNPRTEISVLEYPENLPKFLLNL